MKIIVERLVECRKKIGITKVEAAHRVGVSQPAYLRYESGERTPTVPVIREIAKVMNTSVDYLVGNIESNKPDTISLNKKTDADIYRIADACRKLDKEQLKQVLAFAKEINSKKK